MKHHYLYFIFSYLSFSLLHSNDFLNQRATFELSGYFTDQNEVTISDLELQISLSTFNYEDLSIDTVEQTIQIAQDFSLSFEDTSSITIKAIKSGYHPLSFEYDFPDAFNAKEIDPDSPISIEEQYLSGYVFTKNSIVNKLYPNSTLPAIEYNDIIQLSVTEDKPTAEADLDLDSSPDVSLTIQIDNDLNVSLVISSIDGGGVMLMPESEIEFSLLYEAPETGYAEEVVIGGPNVALEPFYLALKTESGYYGKVSIASYSFNQTDREAVVEFGQRMIQQSPSRFLGIESTD